MKDLCEQCKVYEGCPYGQEDFILKVEDGIEEIIDNHEGVELRPNVELVIAECDEFKGE